MMGRVVRSGIGAVGVVVAARVRVGRRTSPAPDDAGPAAPDQRRDRFPQGVPRGGTQRMRTKSVWYGWITFAAVIMLLAGTINVIEGLVAVIEDEYVVLVQDRLYAVDISGWGWVLLCFGAALVAAAIGLIAQQTW